MNMPYGSTPAFHSLPWATSSETWLARVRQLGLPVLLSSGSSSHNAARYDIITADPELVLRARDGGVELHWPRTGERSFESGSPFAVLEKYCPLVQADKRPGDPDLPFTGGAIGYFGYELLHAANHIDWSDKPRLAHPDMLVGIYAWAIVRDRQTQQCFLVTRGLNADRLSALLALLQQEAPPPAPGDFHLNGPFTSNFTREVYLERLQRIIDYIHAGDCYQVNLTQCFSAPCEGDSWAAFLRLQPHANAPFAAFIEDGELAVLSYSPERFLRVQDKEVLTQPIKGTRPRSADPAQDLANRIDLETSTKDRAENLMIVDLLRNDLGHVCSFGSVEVEQLFETQSFTNVHHLVSTIKGRLEKASDVFRLLEAGFPGGSITGTPKLRAMQIINELETMPRSVYCGAIAWIDASGNMDSNICIRTLVRERDRIHCWGGGGIVADSDGAEEYQETLDKIAILINNL